MNAKVALRSYIGVTMLVVLAASGLIVAGASPASAVDSTLQTGWTLASGSRLQSPNGTYVLKMQADGNLVEYKGSQALWATNTSGSNNCLKMQTDGNLVVYSGCATSKPLWASATGGNSNVVLTIQNDNNVVLYKGTTAIWAKTSNMTTSGVSNRLTAGQSRNSPDGHYHLKMQTDGNFVLYHDSTAIWASNTSGSGNYVTLQTDGNLVVRNSAGTPLWASGTGGNSGAASLNVQPDSNLVIYEVTGPIWAKTSNLSTSHVSNTLTAGQSKRSPNGKYLLAMQTDGNLVEYKGSTALWSTHTTGSSNRVVLQSDGNLVVYSSSNNALWNSKTSGNPGAAVLDVQNDGNVVIYEVTGAIWSRTTGVIGGGQAVLNAALAYAVQPGQTPTTPYCINGGDQTGPTHGGGNSSQWHGGSADSGCNNSGVESTVKGFDCSGLALYAVYKGTNGKVLLPRQSEAQAVASNGTIVPDLAHAQKGDLIFFELKGTTDWEHVGIYDGNSGVVNAYDFKNDGDNGSNNEYWGVMEMPLSWWAKNYDTRIVRFG